MDTKDKIEQNVVLLEGKVIKEIYKQAEAYAALHQTLTSPRGNYFRLQLLQAVRSETSQAELHRLRLAQGMGELDRHINRLVFFQLVKEIPGGEKKWQRTPQGEAVMNAVKKLETEITQEETKKIFTAFLGVNSIRLFLHVYSSKREIDPGKKDISFTTQEIGKISLFLPRSMEGYAAIDKLSDAEILVYSEGDQKVHLDPRKATAFYRYLKELTPILNDEVKNSKLRVINEG